jgi:hypothetical protein
MTLTPKQIILKVAYGTPQEFETAMMRALGEISIEEARDAIEKYRNEWYAAGVD